MTDAELNEAVARKLGHGANGTDCHGYVGIRDLVTGKERRIWPPADYCTDISAAWEVVEYWKKQSWATVNVTFNPQIADGGWMCELFVPKPIPETCTFTALADTAPRAICEAFLKLPDGL